MSQAVKHDSVLCLMSCAAQSNALKLFINTFKVDSIYKLIIEYFKTKENSNGFFGYFCPQERSKKF